MRTNFNDSSNNRGGRYQKRQNGGGNNGGGRRPSSGSSNGRRNPGQHSSNGSINVAAVTATRNKYLDLAKEALSHGNRVEAENYFQHAEHYSKLLNAVPARPERDGAEAGHNNHRRHHNNHRNGNEQQQTPEETSQQPVASQPEIGQEMLPSGT